MIELTGSYVAAGLTAYCALSLLRAMVNTIVLRTIQTIRRTAL